MLIKLLPDQVSNYWDILKPLILDALPPATSKKLGFENKILQNILMGGMDCWVSMNSEGKVGAVCTTTFVEDKNSEVKNLLIYSLSASGGIIEEDEWEEGISTVLKYAQGNGCENVIAYTTSEAMIHLADKYGWDNSVRVVTINLEGK